MNRLFAVLLVLPALAVAGTITHELKLDPAGLSLSRWQGFDVVELDRGHLDADPGEPALPVVTVTLAIPADAWVTSVTATPTRTEVIPGSFTIAPAQEPRPLSATDVPATVAPEPVVYDGTEPWPEATEGRWRTGRAAGFRLAAVDVNPLTWHPADGRLELHTRIRITVEYARDGPAQHLTLTQRDRASAGLARLVANPKDLTGFASPTAALDLPEIDYLVITNNRLAPEFIDFAEYKTARGHRTEIRTVEWIERRYPGRDLQEKTRNMIRDYFDTRGLCYVLLGGDNAVVPSRRIRVWVGNTRGDIPADLYFADLDFSWDSNHNNLFGEMGDSVDFYSDVIVGRASVDTEAQVRNFTDKVRTYENNPAADYIKRALFPSGWLWRNRNYHGRYVHDSIAGITPAGWNDVRMVDPPGSFAVADSFDHGFAIFDPAGHGNEGGIYCESGTAIYTSGLARNQTNDRRFTIMTSLACTPGNFEAEDCIAEIAHNCEGGGCIAVMMNSRYGWGTPPSMGPSEKLCIRFYDFYLARGEYVLGNAHSRSREEYAGAALYGSLWRWCMTEFNLFGDPTLDIWTEPPAALQVCPADTTIPTGDRVLDVTVSDNYGPVTGATVCAWKGDEVHTVAVTNSSGRVSLTIRPLTPGSLSVTATAHDFLPDCETVTVTQGAPEPYIVYHASAIDDQGQPRENGVLEPGETGRLSLAIRNIGMAAASNAGVVLRIMSGNASLPDSTAQFGTVAPGDTVTATGLSVHVEPDIYPGASVEILAVVTAESREWEFTFLVPVGFPGRVCATIDTTACALTFTARGNIGFDMHDGHDGRGFRFPQDDTSSLNIASFCLAGPGGYVADRFYTDAELPLDRDWTLRESLYAEALCWQSQQLLRGSFTDAGHPDARNVRVIERALGTSEPGSDRFVILVYDIMNDGADAMTGLYAGILADFDILATDRFHDLAGTSPLHRSAWMRSVMPTSPFCGVKLLYPDLPCNLAVIDHDRYVYPDSGFSESMKYRCLKGELGGAASDRAYNWSVSVGTGPFNLAPGGGRQRVAFAFVAAEDSVGYLTACAASQQWFNDNVGIKEPGQALPRATDLTVYPNPFARNVTIRFNRAPAGPVRIRAYDASGRFVARLHDGPLTSGSTVTWNPRNLPAGVYILRVADERDVAYQRVTLAR